MVSAFSLFVSAAADFNQPLDLQAQTVYVQCSQTTSNDEPECIATCPEGTVLTGGGINTMTNSSYLKVNLAAPDALNNRFRCYVRNESVDQDLFYFCYANCLSGDVSITPQKNVVVVPLF
jgi:hypothetical protein